MKLFVVLSLAFCFANAAFAAPSYLHGFQFGTGVSVTSGLTATIGYRNPASKSFLSRHFGVRIDWSETGALKSAIDSVIESYMSDGVDVGSGVKIDNGRFDSWQTGFTLDFYPFSGNWRISGGYSWGRTKLHSDIFGRVENAPSQRFYFNLGGDHYYYNGNEFDGRAKVNWGYHGPYIGTGLDINLFCGFYLFFDAGVIYTSQTPKMALDISNRQLYIYDTATQSWRPVTIAQMESDIDRAQRDANRDLSKIHFYPMLKMGFLFRF